MEVFCKTFESEVFGQIVVMRDFEEDKEKLKFMYMFGGAVQQLSRAFHTEMAADNAFDITNLDVAEKALEPFVEFEMLDSLTK